MRTQSLVSFVTLALFASSSLANPVPVSGSNGYKVSLKVGRDATEGMQYDRLQYRQAPASASPDAAGTAHSEVTFVKGALQGATAGGANPVVGLMGNVRRGDGAGVGPSGVAVNKLLLNGGSSPNLGYVKRVSTPATEMVTAQESALKGLNSENVVQNSGYETPDTTSFGSRTASAHIPVRVGLKDGQDGGNSKSNGAGSTDHASLSLSSSKSSGLGDSIVANNPTGMHSDMETLSGSVAPLSDPLQAADTAIDSKNIAHRSKTGFVLSGNPIVALVGSPGATDDNLRGAIDRVTIAGLDVNKALGILGGGNTDLLGGAASGSELGPSALASLSPSGSAGGKSGDNALLDGHVTGLSGSIVTPSSDTKTSGSAAASGDTTIGGPIRVSSPKTSTLNTPVGTPAQPDGQLDDASNRNIANAGVGVSNIPAQNVGANGIPALGSSGPASTSPNLGGAIPNVQSGSVPNLPIPNEATNALTNAPGSIPSLGSPGQGGSTPSIPGVVSIPSGSIPSLQGSQGNSGSSPSLPGLGGISTPPSGPNPLLSPPGNGGSTPGLGLSGPQGSIPNVDNLPRPIPSLDTNAGTSVGKDQKSVETSLGTGKPDLSSSSNGSQYTSNAPIKSASNPLVGPDAVHFGPGPVIVNPISTSGSNTVSASAPPSDPDTNPPSLSLNNGNSGSGSSTPTVNPAPNTPPSTALGSGSAAAPYPFNLPTGAYPNTFPYQYVEGKGWVAADGSVLPFGTISPDIFTSNGSPLTGPNGVKYQYVPGSGIVGSDGSVFPIQYVAGQGYMASGGNMVYGSNGVYYAPKGAAYASNGVPYGPIGFPTDTKDGGVLSSAAGSDAITHVSNRDDPMRQFNGAAAQNKVVDTCLESAPESTHMQQSRWFKGDALNDAMTAEPVPHAITTAEDAVAYPLNMRRGDSDANNAYANGIAGNGSGENNGNNDQYRGNNGNSEHNGNNNGNGVLAKDGNENGHNGNGANNNGVLGNTGNDERNRNGGNVRAYANQRGAGGVDRYNYEMTDLEALNYLLTLEEFETAFYEQSLERFSEDDFMNLGYPRWVRPRYEQILSHERVHKEFLQSAITSAGQNYVEPCNYELGNVNDPRNFVEFSEAIQSIITGAYVGILRYFNERSYITAGASILAVEARQAAWINSAVRHKNPWNSAFETALTPSQVYTLLSSFFDFNSLTEDNRALLPAGIWPAPRLSLAPRLLPGQQGEISFPYPNLNEHECLYVVFLTGAANIVAPLINQNNGHYFVEIPLELEGAGTVYIILIRGSDNIGDVVVSDQTTVAGPAIAEFPYNAEGKRGMW